MYCIVSEISMLVCITFYWLSVGGSAISSDGYFLLAMPCG